MRWLILKLIKMYNALTQSKQIFFPRGQWTQYKVKLISRLLSALDRHEKL
jgi:hypothetical protein